ncbi:substrate-binding domain-containing protein [Parasphaerochaeta coccoides]|uniref:Oxygen sensor histidine kinase NreB n=1 Tax=Parasphaerochaeta coccoides (strain ATCC BAA-1237 / DSM 17374 / SPN1) TaxID=760011 RepID=F4GLI2_PARC1|nr:substrate-binding domain-containing protein [Parasphaerochaeta coccoides]AEC01952.1 histidine kinase [Parasphaerochaeta coccoides DSM 17374]
MDKPCIILRMVKNQKKKKSKLRLGFLASQFDESYQYAVWNGAAREAEKLGMSNVFYVGANLETQNKAGSLDDTAFALAARTELDGLLIMTNTMGSIFSHDRISGYMTAFHDIPTVTVGVRFPGIPGICADTSGGIAVVTRHLIEGHQRKRFLFLAGPLGHPESEQRLKEFLDTYAMLLPDGQRPLVLHGDFLEDKAYAIVRSLVEKRWEWDAVVAANDQMAMGSIRALTEQGLAVPGQVSVTGFDDIEDSLYSLPPLTTIHQPAGELGERAVRELARILGILEPAEEDDRQLVSTFVLRTSCGCMQPKGRDSGKVHSFTLENQLRHQMSRRVAGETRNALLQDVQSALISSFSMEKILKELARGIRQLGICFCSVVMFDTKDPTWSELLMTTQGNETRILAPYGFRFRTQEMLPGGLPDDFASFVCEPLQFGEEPIGYLVCSTGAQDRHVYATLRDLLTISLKGARVMASERDREKALAKEVGRRTAELSYANNKLKVEIAQRKNLEREILDVSNDIMTRIGQDIHDELCQDIAGIGILAATLEDSLGKKGLKQERIRARQISETAMNTAKNAKKIARNLYPVELEDNGLATAVRRLAASRSSREGSPSIHVDVQEDFLVRRPEKALQLFRIIQEALSNAIRHAHAENVKIGLYMDHGMVTVEISDDGHGMEASEQESGQGMGLKILKYRANMIGGLLRIQTSPEGTSISCRVSR